jgi:hypothetical protein
MTEPLPPYSGDNPTCDHEEEIKRLRTENAAAISLIQQQDEAIQRVRNLANQIALDSPWGRETATRFRLAVQPAAPDGPTVREAAADDRRWPLESEGE